MSLIPRMYRPSVIIRRKAMRQGVMGQSLFWKVVAAGVYGPALLKKVFGRQVEVIDTASLGPGRFMQVTTSKPLTRRQRRRARRSGASAASTKQVRAEAASLAESLARSRST